MLCPTWKRFVCLDVVDTTPVFRKSTYTDQYLAYDSHHPQSVTRGIVTCLYDRATHLTTKPSVSSEEKKHLSSVIVSDGYPSSLVRKLAKTTRLKANKESAQEFKSTAVLPYIKGVSEVLTRHTNCSQVGYNARSKVKFIDCDPHCNTRRVKEAIHIKLHPGSINSPSMDTHDQKTQQPVDEDLWGYTSNSRNNNENRNAPIQAYQRATIDLIAWWRLAVLQSKRRDLH